MQTVHVTFDAILEIPDDEKANQIDVVQEFLDKLYVGAEHYENDVFTVKDITLTAFIKS
jgi:hypothetical protein